MKRLCLTISAVACVFAAAAQNADSLAGVYMNGEDWFALRRHVEQRRGEMSPFFVTFSEALVYGYFNRPQESCEAIDRLIDDYGDELGFDNVMSMTVQKALTLGNSGRNAEAAAAIGRFRERMADRLTAEQTAMLRSQETLCGELSRYRLFVRADERATVDIPFRFDTLNERNAYMMVLDGELNGRPFDVVFDTGAGVNVVSPEVAERCGMEFLDAAVSAAGITSAAGRIAVAREFRLGGVVLENVPFYVLDLRTGNEQADEYLSRLQVIMGVPTMDALGNIRLDIGRKVMTVSDRPFDDDDTGWADLCCVNGNMRIEARQPDGGRLTFTLDTGSQSSSFNPNYYIRNRERLEAAGHRDSIGVAGFGGAVRTEVLTIPYERIEVGGHMCYLCNVAVHLPDNAAGHMFNRLDGTLGLDLFLHFTYVYLDMERMRLGTRY